MCEGGDWRRHSDPSAVAVVFVLASYPLVFNVILTSLISSIGRGK